MKAILRLIVLTLSIAAALAVVSGTSGAVTGAAFTTTNTNVDGTGHCKNGNEDINCNHYDGKEFVWLNGGPSVAYVGDGDYFFAVLAPGGQANPNDGTPKNLSDDFDAYANRSINVVGGTVTYDGTHDFDSNKIRLFPYADTPNPGGVYILAICSLDKGYPVTPSRCKYDAFKVQEADEPPSAFGLTVVKDASGTYDKTWTWGIEKSADQTMITLHRGSVPVQYSVKASRSAAVKSNIIVTGTITVFNPNIDDNGDVVPVHHVTVTDHLSNGVDCPVQGASDVTISTAEQSFTYVCEFEELGYGRVHNTATVSWEAQTLSNGAQLPAGSETFIFSDIPLVATKIDSCAKVSDVFDGGTPMKLGTPCGTKTFIYTRSIPAPKAKCATHNNVATLTTVTTRTQVSDGETVTVCKG